MAISLPAILCCSAALLSAQPDPVRDCRRQASVATGAAIAEIDARVFQFMILWTAVEEGRTLNGYCEADRAGRIVHFELSPRGPAVTNSATSDRNLLEDCRRQASISTGEEIAAIETRQALGLILWQVKSGIRRVEGFCQTDARTSRIVRFDAGRDEIEDRVSTDDAIVTCERAARLKLGADVGDVAGTFESLDNSNYRIQWRYEPENGDRKTGWCRIDSMTGRVRKVEASGGW